LTAGAFSFNSKEGQCERCRGAGFEKIEMQFLSDVYIRCADCEGRRFRPHVLEVKLGPAPSAVDQEQRATPRPGNAWSIADLLEATVDEALTFLERFRQDRLAERASLCLRQLTEVGLGYLRLGQPVSTLSGGENQRLKLAQHLARFTRRLRKSDRGSLFLLDEPTTGLHFADVDVLVNALQRLVKAGHSVWVIEHNLELIKCSDWVLDLGPEAGALGGKVVAEGPPEVIAGQLGSHTGKALAELGLSAMPDVQSQPAGRGGGRETKRGRRPRVRRKEGG
jgi:excinuclease ABC subunit A